MGFSSSLQGKSSHEALLQRQDAELKLLENLKRWLVLRIKCDRDYASALVSLTSITSKFEKSEELSGSLLSQAVHTAIENSETIASLLKQNADYLSNVTLEKLNALLNDKRNTRKFYQEEYNRLITESQSLQDSVHRAKIEYEKSVDGYKAAYSKYEELTLNPKSKGSSKKSEEVIKEKFQRAVKRLHIAHNDYVLNLLESADYERDFRTVLLPGINNGIRNNKNILQLPYKDVALITFAFVYFTGLLEFQQVVQEDILHQCHTVIEEISQYSDFSSEPFKLLFKMLQSRVEEITAENEFKEFIEKNKSAPIAAQPPIFDAKLSALQDNNHSNPLRPDRVAVDDLTLEALKQKLRLLEQRLSSVQSELALKVAALQKIEAEFAVLKKADSSGKE
jgi:tyrosine-protein kinase Fer